MLLQLDCVLPLDLASGITQMHWNIPEWAYKPSQWTFAFLRGLRKLHLEEEIGWEIGVGTGLNILLVGKWFPRTKLYFSDLKPECTELTVANLLQAGIRGSDQFKPLHGKWDLTKRLDEKCKAPSVDLVFGCIPQIPLPRTIDLEAGDNLANYYDPRKYQGQQSLGLGLNQALLKQVQGILTDQGQIVLNLGGRPGKNRLLTMFSTCGFQPQILHQEIIRQEPETSLESLAETERNSGREFEFFGDLEAKEQINAEEAENRRRQDIVVYHYIYIIAGRRAQ